MEAQISWCNFLPKNPQSSSLLSSSFTNNIVKGKSKKRTNMITAAAKPPSSTTITTTTTKHRFFFSSLVDDVLNNLDDLICAFLDKPLRPDNDPSTALGENCKPVGPEVPPTPCHVIEGSLPPSLDGAYIRNGPNPRFPPKGPYNILDGDGMLQTIRISRGRATFFSRYVRTHKLESEARIGRPVVPNFVAGFNNGPAASLARSLVAAARVFVGGHFDPFGKGVGVANTSVALISGRLFALCESDLPYEISVDENGDVITIGRHDFRSVDEPAFVRMTAHPKTDRETGETFAYRYGPLRPFLTFHRIDREGRKTKDVPIHSKKDCSVVHDFGLTETRAVFPDTQIAINPSWIFSRARGFAVGIDDDKVPRLGVIPRYAEDEGEMVWVEAPEFNMVHCMNAWDDDEEDNIVMIATNARKVEHLIGQTQLSELTIEKVTIDVEAKRVERQRLSSAAGKFHEFGTINPAYANKKIRYVYAGVILSESRSIVGVEKFDLSLIEKDDGGDCTVASRMYGAGCHTGESFFVAKDPNNPTAEEDDGYLITYVHDENADESRFLVMDAKSPDLDIVAAVKLPRRVPNGLHSLFVSEDELNNLLSK